MDLIYIAASLTIALKVSLSNFHKETFGLAATTLAALGQLYSRANSPKVSPGE